MEKALKEKWLKALRSGQYKQTAGVLKRQFENGDCRYCCLGVLCDVSGEGEWDTKAHNTSYLVNGTTHWISFPPTSLVEKHNISNKTVSRLTRMNDADRLSFEEIADWIETNIEEEA